MKRKRVTLGLLVRRMFCVSLPVCVNASVSHPEEVLELWTVVECRYVGSKQKHGLCGIPPFFNHGLLKPP